MRERRSKGNTGISVTRRKQRVNVLEREVMEIKIVISEKHVQTQMCVKVLINTHA